MSVPTIASIKSRAKEIKSERQVRHAEALDLASQEANFADWMDAHHRLSLTSGAAQVTSSSPAATNKAPETAPAASSVSFLSDKEEKNGVELIAYASGDGSLTLLFKKRVSGLASSLRVTRRDADEYLRRRERAGKALTGYKVFMDGPSRKLYRPVERLASDELLLGGRSYRYERVGAQSITVFSEEGDEVKNLSTKASLLFFLNNEERLS